MTKFTVLGGRGFIGTRLAAALKRAGHDVSVPARNSRLIDRPLGHVMYCIGVTSDFRTRPFDTVAAHVCKLNQVLRYGEFDSLTYLSSTRVYAHNTGPVDETSAVSLDVSRSDDLYNASKLMGESLALHCSRPTRVVRLSNVYGSGDTSDNFLTSIMRQALDAGSITLESGAASRKDYLSLVDAVEILPQIALYGAERIYNLASGENTSHAQLTQGLAETTGCTVHFAPDAPNVVFPPISIDRVCDEFDFKPRSLADDLPSLVASYRRAARELAIC